MGGRLTPLINTIEWFISMLPWWQRVRLCEVFHNGGFIMKKKLLSIGLLLSFAAQANPVKGLFKLSGASMTQAATTAVDHVATEAATPVTEVATPVVETTWSIPGWNSTKAVCAAVRDGATTFVAAHPTGTRVAAGVVAGTAAALAAYKYFKAPAVVEKAKAPAVVEKALDQKALAEVEEFVKTQNEQGIPCDATRELQKIAKQTKLAHEVMCKMANGSAANTTAVEVVAPVVTREVAPVVNALDAEVARLRNKMHGLGYSSLNSNLVNDTTKALYFSDFSAEAIARCS